MGFGPGCHEVRTGSAYVAYPGCDGLVKLATCSHMRSIPQYDVPTSAQHVYGNLRDKWTCQAGSLLAMGCSFAGLPSLLMSHIAKDAPRQIPSNLKDFTRHHDPDGMAGSRNSPVFLS